MTKADLLHRFRWVLLVLPTATAAGFRILNACEEVNLFTLAPFNVSVGSLLKGSAVYAEPGWMWLTVACSILTAYSIIGDKREGYSVAVQALLVPVILGIHVALVMGLFRLFPL